MNTFSQISIISMTTVCGVKCHAALFSYKHYLRAPYYLELFLNLETFYLPLQGLFAANAGIVHRYIAFIRAYMIVLIIFAKARAIYQTHALFGPFSMYAFSLAFPRAETSTKYHLRYGISMQA